MLVLDPQKNCQIGAECAAVHTVNHNSAPMCKSLDAKPASYRALAGSILNTPGIPYCLLHLSLLLHGNTSCTVSDSTPF